MKKEMTTLDNRKWGLFPSRLMMRMHLKVGWEYFMARGFTELQGINYFGDLAFVSMLKSKHEPKMSIWFQPDAMMPTCGMHSAGTRHGYGMYTDFTNKK